MRVGVQKDRERGARRQREAGQEREKEGREASVERLGRHFSYTNPFNLM